MDTSQKKTPLRVAYSLLALSITQEKIANDWVVIFDRMFLWKKIKKVER